MKTHPLLLNDREIELIKELVAFYVTNENEETYESFQDAKDRGFKEGLLEVLLEKLPQTSWKVGA